MREIFVWCNFCCARSFVLLPRRGRHRLNRTLRPRVASQPQFNGHFRIKMYFILYQAFFFLCIFFLNSYWRRKTFWFFCLVWTLMLCVLFIHPQTQIYKENMMRRGEGNWLSLSLHGRSFWLLDLCPGAIVLEINKCCLFLGRNFKFWEENQAGGEMFKIIFNIQPWACRINMCVRVRFFVYIFPVFYTKTLGSIFLN